jgi:uncharacterized Zn finger protein
MTAQNSTATPVFGHTWWGRAWVEAMEQRGQLDPNRLPRGAVHARDGSVTEPAFAPGEITAEATGRRTQPYFIRVRVRQLSIDEWDRVLTAIANQVGHTAALLDGDLPPAIADDLTAIGLSLLPGPGEIGPRCTCPDEADPCKHAAAVCYRAAEALDHDPFLVFLLRGRTRDDVLASLRSRRRAEAPIPTQTRSADRPALSALAPDLTFGTDARAALAARDQPLPPIPVVPLPPMRPGQPSALPVDPPPGYEGLREALRSLAADTAARAWQLATGQTRTAGLELSGDEDLARRAARMIGTPGFDALAARTSIPPRELLRWGLAWRHGGAGGFAVLRNDWDPTTELAGGASDFTHARRALRDVTGTVGRVTRNRLTAARCQLRLGRDLLWYPYVRAADTWEPAGTPHHDPDEATRRWRPSTTVW